MSYKDNITLTVYWPPTKDYVNDTQYRYLAEAGINYILGAGEETLHTPDIQGKMLQLCDKYGMGMTLHDGNFGPALLDKSEGEIAACVRKYKNVAGCAGFYLQDEPFNPNIYTDAACAIKKVWADASLHLNFLPRFSYDSDAMYANQMNDWCAVCRANGFDVDWLTYDFYPFGFGEGNMNREGFYKNLMLCHKVGRHNKVKTGIYLQSVSLLDGYPTPGENELRYEINLALAYGFKWLSYFTWFTPINRPGEQFADGIMTEHGEPTPLYEVVKRLNRGVLNVGSTLVNCEAAEIYCNGGRYGVPSIPEGFFVRAIDDGDYMLSHLIGSDGRHYIMAVNNDFTSSQTVNLKFDRSVSELSVLSYDDGKLHPIQSNVGAVSLDLCPGGAAIIALPVGYEPMQYRADGKNADLCLDARICCTNSAGQGGYYISALNDGKRKPAPAIKGWKTYRGKTEADIIIEFPSERTVNRIDLYKSSDPEFPSQIQVYSSRDGVEYTCVCEKSGVSASGCTAYSIEFDSVQARYIKLHVSDSPLGSIALCEIEIFNKTNTEHKIPTCTELYGAENVVKYTEGEDIAKGKTVFSSSTVSDTYRQIGWANDFINDGKSDTGFSSAVGIHSMPEAAEFAVIDLGDMFCINSIVLTARGCFPHDYRIQISDDCTDWYDAVEMFDVCAEDGQRFEYAIEDIEGRYVRLFATELTSKSEADGYLLQMGGIEVYGVPVCDRTELLNTLQEYEQSGADTGSEAYKRAYGYANAEYLTQSMADACVQVLSALYTLDAVEFTSDHTVYTPQVRDTKKQPPRVQKKAIFAAVAGAVVTAMAVATVVLVNTNTKNNKSNKKKKLK